MVKDRIALIETISHYEAWPVGGCDVARVLLFVLGISIFISCGIPNSKSKNSGNIMAAKSTPEAIRKASPPEDVNLLCNSISEIRALPFKGEKGEDPIYDALIAAGEAAIPCLIKRITDTTQMDDPRRAPKYQYTTVGDIAYFILIDITKLDFIELLPQEVQVKYKKEGVYAYFSFVEKMENRQKLQNELSKWYRKKYGKEAL